MSQHFYLLIWQHTTENKPQTLNHLPSKHTGSWHYLMLHALQAEAAHIPQIHDFEGILLEVKIQSHWQISLCYQQQKYLLVSQPLQTLDQPVCWHLSNWPVDCHEAYHALPLAQDLPQTAHLLLGALPAVLQNWQLTGIFGDMPQQSQQNTSQTSEYDAVQTIQTALQGLQVQPFDSNSSGFKVFQLADLSRFYRLGWFVSDQAEALIQISSWQGDLPDWPTGGVSHLQATAQGFVIHLDPSATPFGIFHKLDEALQLLTPVLQNGCQLELQIAEVSLDDSDSEAPDPGASQIYRFDVRDAALHLVASWPELPVTRLQQALALSAWVEQGGIWEFDSQQHFDDFLEMARQRDDYWLSDIRKSSLGIELKDEADRAFAARSLFRQDFGDVWNLQQAQALEAEDLEAGGLFQGAIDQVLKAIRKPHTDEVLLDGDSGIFMRGDVTGLSANQQENLRILTQAFQQLDYRYLGDLVWLPGGDVLMRVLSDAHSHAAIMLTMHGIHFEIQTVFSDGSALLSSTVPELCDEPRLQLLRFSLPDASPSELVTFHQANIRRSGKEAQAATADWNAFLKQLDQQLKRQLALRASSI